MLNIIIQRQLRLAWVDTFTHISSMVFYLICITIFNIAIGPYQLDESVKTALLFTPLLLSSILNADFLLKDDYKSSWLHQIYLIPEVWVWNLVGKLLAYVVIQSVMVLVSFPISFLILDIGLSQLWYYLCVGLALICYLSPLLLLGSVMTLTTNFSVLMPILLLPMIVPALILATLSQQNSVYFLLLVALTLLTLPILVFLSSKLLEEVLKTD